MLNYGLNLLLSFHLWPSRAVEGPAKGGGSIVAPLNILCQRRAKSFDFLLAQKNNKYYKRWRWHKIQIHSLRLESDDVGLIVWTKMLGCMLGFINGCHMFSRV